MNRYEIVLCIKCKNYISTVPRHQKQIETGNFCTYYKVSRMKSANHGAYISQNSWGYIDLTTSVGADYKGISLGYSF